MGNNGDTPEIIGNIDASDTEALTALGQTTGEPILSISSMKNDMADIRTGTMITPTSGSGTDLIVRMVAGKWVVAARAKWVG